MGRDRTQNILWRLNNGELDEVNPKVVVLHAGTNNIGNALPEDIAAGIKEILRVVESKAPNSTIIVTGILPRNDNMELISTVNKINSQLAGLASRKKIRYLNINEKLADRDGKLLAGMMDPDKVHPTAQAYQVWADALKPLLAELLGQPAKEDHAPPPTGDPSKRL